MLPVTMSSMGRQECTIVHLDDDANDLLFFQAALLRTDMPIRVCPFLSPDKAVAWLEETAFSGEEEAPAPSLFLCDYNLGPVQGHEIVPVIRAMPACAPMSIVIWSGATQQEAVLASYRAGANHFLKKPMRAERMDILVRTLYDCAISTNFAALTRLEEYCALPAD